MRKVLIIAIILACEISLRADTLHVPSQYNTIQEALYSVSTGDTIMVAPGNYENFVWSGNFVQGIHLLGSGAFGDSSSTISSNNVAAGALLDEAVGWEIAFFQFTACYHGIYAEYCQNLNIHHNYFYQNEIGNSAGVFIEYNDDLEFHHNTVAYNHYAGMFIDGLDNAEIYNNNIVYTTGYHGILMLEYHSGVRFINNIIAFNSDDGIQTYGGQGDAVIEYNDCYNNGSNYAFCSPGLGCISVNPLFENQSAGNYQLLENSPCIDAGDPAYPPDPDSTRADIGAFFFDQFIPPVDDLVIIIENENVILTWIDIPNAQRYFIYRDTIPNFQISTPIGTSTTATYSDSSALLEERYYYKITYR